MILKSKSAPSGAKAQENVSGLRGPFDYAQGRL
jgi:hypothetical protein